MSEVRWARVSPGVEDVSTNLVHGGPGVATLPVRFNECEPAEEDCEPRINTVGSGQ
jgi:hypothetical protein